MKMMKKHKRLIIILIIVIAVIVISYYGNEIKSISNLLSKGSIDELVFLMKNSKIAPLISIALMILQSFLAPIPSFLIAGANGIVFGIPGGVLVSWIGAMFGAAGTFYLSRMLGEPFVRRFEKSSSLLQKVEEIGEKHGAKVIFIGRLLPFVSFDFLSYAAGLSSIKAWKFFVATGIGMLPGTILYVAVGNQIGVYQRYSNYIIGIVIIGIMLYFLWRWMKRKKLKSKKLKSKKQM